MTPIMFQKRVNVVVVYEPHSGCERWYLAEDWHKDPENAKPILERRHPLPADVPPR